MMSAFSHYQTTKPNCSTLSFMFHFSGLLYGRGGAECSAPETAGRDGLGLELGSGLCYNPNTNPFRTSYSAHYHAPPLNRCYVL